MQLIQLRAEVKMIVLQDYSGPKTPAVETAATGIESAAKYRKVPVNIIVLYNDGDGFLSQQGSAIILQHPAACTGYLYQDSGRNHWSCFGNQALMSKSFFLFTSSPEVSTFIPYFRYPLLNTIQLSRGPEIVKYATTARAFNTKFLSLDSAPLGFNTISEDRNTTPKDLQSTAFNAGDFDFTQLWAEVRAALSAKAHRSVAKSQGMSSSKTNRGHVRNILDYFHQQHITEMKGTPNASNLIETCASFIPKEILDHETELKPDLQSIAKKMFKENTVGNDSTTERLWLVGAAIHRAKKKWLYQGLGDTHPTTADLLLVRKSEVGCDLGIVACVESKRTDTSLTSKTPVSDLHPVQDLVFNDGFSIGLDFHTAWVGRLPPYIISEIRQKFSLTFLYVVAGDKSLQMLRSQWMVFAQKALANQLFLDRSDKEDKDNERRPDMSYFGYIIFKSKMEIWRMTYKSVSEATLGREPTPSSRGLTKPNYPDHSEQRAQKLLSSRHAINANNPTPCRPEEYDQSCSYAQFACHKLGTLELTTEDDFTTFAHVHRYVTAWGFLHCEEYVSNVFNVFIKSSIRIEDWDMPEDDMLRYWGLDKSLLGHLKRCRNERG